VKRGAGTAGIGQHVRGDGYDMQGPACQWQGREEAVWQKAQLRKENVLSGIQQRRPGQLGRAKGKATDGGLAGHHRGLGWLGQTP
jgi:hypothetical protein